VTLRVLGGPSALAATSGAGGGLFGSGGGGRDRLGRGMASLAAGGDLGLRGGQRMLERHILVNKVCGEDDHHNIITIQLLKWSLHVAHLCVCVFLCAGLCCKGLVQLMQMFLFRQRTFFLDCKPF